MSQQEDDLRALAKIMDFLRAVSIILVVMNVYWFCYEVIKLWGVNIGVVDKILLNFDRTAGLFHSIPVSYTHLDVYKRQPLCRGNFLMCRYALWSIPVQRPP